MGFLSCPCPPPYPTLSPPTSSECQGLRLQALTRMEVEGGTGGRRGRHRGFLSPPPRPDSLGSGLGPLEGRVASEADRSALFFLIAGGRGGAGSTLYPLLPLFRYQGPGSPVSYAPFQGPNSRKRRVQDLTSCLQNRRDPREGWPLTLSQLLVPHSSLQEVSLSC